jgi:hypothetical protein
VPNSDDPDNHFSIQDLSEASPTGFIGSLCRLLLLDQTLESCYRLHSALSLKNGRNVDSEKMFIVFQHPLRSAALDDIHSMMEQETLSAAQTETNDRQTKRRKK